jgi:uncharacterized membrane protein
LVPVAIVVVVVGGEGAIVVIVGTTIVPVVSVAVSPTPPGAADASLPPAAFRGTWTMGEDDAREWTLYSL